MDTRPDRRWEVLGATVTGAAHRAHGRRSEDAFSILRLGDSSAAAVADGHGSPRCPRADRGAQQAAHLAVELLAELGGRVELSALEVELRDRVGPALVERWREAVEADHSADPFSPEENRAVGADDGRLMASQVWMAYGTTVLAVLATPDALAVLQIGDGDLVVVGPSGAAWRPLPDDPSNRGNVTTSLAQSDPTAALRCCVLDQRHEPIPLAFIASDGFGGAYEDADWWVDVGRDLADRAARLDIAQLRSSLPRWLQEPADVGGDDATMVLLVATSAAATSTPPAETAAAKAGSPPSTDDDRTSRA